MSSERAAPHAYAPVSRFLHWLTALLVVGMFALGWGREFVHGPLKAGMMAWHQGIGFAVLGIAALRMAVRFVTRAPAAAGHTAALRLAVHAGHGLLYAGLLLLPLCGWAMVSAMGRPAHIGGFVLPALLGPDPALAKQLQLAHTVLAYGLAGLTGGHTIAAVYHHVILGDGTLRRMAPRRAGQ